MSAKKTSKTTPKKKPAIKIAKLTDANLKKISGGLVAAKPSCH